MAVTPTSLGTTKVAGSTGEIADTNTRNLAINQLTNATTGAVVKGELVFNVKDYGAVGNGSTDDTAAIELARTALVAAGGGVMQFQQGKTYLVSKITISANICYVGSGCTVKGSSAVPEGIFQAQGWGGATTIYDAEISGFRIDGNNVARRGVFLYLAQRCHVYDNVIFNMPITGDSGVRLHLDTVDCVVRNNHITMATDSPFGTVAAAAGIYVVSTMPDLYGGGQNDTLTFGTATALSKGHLIEGNHVYNGTHSISLSGAQNCRIIGNYLYGPTHRGIILSLSLRIVMADNTILEFGSTGIHLCWGSCFNTITGNTCVTTVSAVEGNGIKGYYGCSDNTVVGNFVEGALFGAIRFSMGSVRNLIADNRVRGSAIGVHIQSGIPGAGYYVPATPPNAESNTVRGNLISSTATGIWLDSQGTADVTDTSLTGNDILDPATVGVLISEAGGRVVSGVQATGTRITGTGTKWTLARGEQHFGHKSGNTGLITTPGNGNLKSGCYYQTTRATAAPGAFATLGNGTARATAFQVPNAVTVTRIGTEITVIGDAGCVLRFGIWADDGTGFPGNLILDAGTVAADTTGIKEITISQALNPGTYWVAAIVQGVTTTQPTVRAYATGAESGTVVPLTAGTTPSAGLAITCGYSKTGVTGAIPSTWGASVAITASAAALFVKIA